MSYVSIVYLGNCLLGKTSIWANVFLGKCLLGKMLRVRVFWENE
jgi:hypothetical protein